MRILWISNVIFPYPSKTLGLPTPVFGGWMYGLAAQIASQDNFSLAVAAVYSGKDLWYKEIEGIKYYLIPFKASKGYPKRLEPYWKSLCEEFMPDLVHIHGTEYLRALACLRSVQNCKYIVSIQGMAGPLSNYYLSGISIGSLIRNITIRDILRNEILFMVKRRWKRSGELEKEYYEKADVVVGRTSWDYCHTKAINSNASYFYCNESLRDEFYEAKKWNLLKCQRHTIFLSQAGYPLKGLHKVLEAVYLIKNEFPSLRIRIGGNTIIANQTVRDKIRISGYGKYIRFLLKKYQLFENVQFLGPLKAEMMIEEYQRAHIFICPSSIENSPNSLGEAQLIGTPVIASYVGGIPDMVMHKETGILYRFEEVEMLAYFIRECFLNDSLTDRISQNAILAAEMRHDRLVNFNCMVGLYQSLIK